MGCSVLLHIIVCTCLIYLTRGDQTEIRVCGIKIQEAPSIADDIFLFPLSWINSEDDGKKADVQTICSEDTNLIESIIEQVSAAMFTVWRLISDSIPVPDTESLKHYVAEEHIHSITRVGNLIQQYCSRLLTLISPYFTPVMEVAHLLLENLSACLTSLPQFAQTYLPGVITDAVSHMTSYVSRVTYTGWLAVIRYMVALLVTVSCVKYMFPTATATKERRKVPLQSNNSCRLKLKRSRNTRSHHASVKVDSRDSRRHESLLAHYPMCEFFDSKPCNCGGTGNDDVISVARHFSMCEYFDGLSCNCGGRYSAGPSPRGPSIDLDQERTGKYQGLGGSPLFSRGRPTVHNTQLSPVALPHGIGDEPKHAVKMRKSDLEKPAPTEDLDENVVGSGTGAGQLDDSVVSDIGQPCFNSSFKEDSSFGSQSSHTAEPIITSHRTSHMTSPCDALAAGDGIDSVILTRRSPYKEVGVSFDESTCSEKLESFYDANSFLDATDLNSSLSFHQGGGVLELTLAFLFKQMFSWGMWFLRRRGMAFPTWKVYGLNSPSRDKSRDSFYLMLPGNRSRRRSVRTQSLSRNNSASVLAELSEDGLAMDEISHDQSVLEQLGERHLTEEPIEGACVSTSSSATESTDVDKLRDVLQSLSMDRLTSGGEVQQDPDSMEESDIPRAPGDQCPPQHSAILMNDSAHSSQLD